MKNPMLIVSLLTVLSCAGPQQETTTEPQDPFDAEAELAQIEETRAQVILALKEARYQDIGQFVTKDTKTVRPGGLILMKCSNKGKNAVFFLMTASACFLPRPSS